MNWFALLGLQGLNARWREVRSEVLLAVQDRLALARLEGAQLRGQLARLLLLTVAVVCLAVVALLLLAAALLVQFWDSPQRALVAWLLAGGMVLALVLGCIGLLRCLRRCGTAFALTRRELAEDLRGLREQGDA